MKEEINEWVAENKKELIEDFVNENINEFDNFMQEEIVDEDRTFNYWKMQFCEENEQEFNEYCESAYNNMVDKIQTENSLMRAI